MEFQFRLRNGFWDIPKNDLIGLIRHIKYTEQVDNLTLIQFIRNSDYLLANHLTYPNHQTNYDRSKAFGLDVDKSEFDRQVGYIIFVSTNTFPFRPPTIEEFESGIYFPNPYRSEPVKIDHIEEPTPSIPEEDINEEDMKSLDEEFGIEENNDVEENTEPPAESVEEISDVEEENEESKDENIIEEDEQIEETPIESSDIYDEQTSIDNAEDNVINESDNTIEEEDTSSTVQEEDVYNDDPMLKLDDEGISELEKEIFSEEYFDSSEDSNDEEEPISTPSINNIDQQNIDTPPKPVQESSVDRDIKNYYEIDDIDKEIEALFKDEDIGKDIDE